MKEDRVLFQIKSLDKLILKTFMQDKEFAEKREKFAMPTPTQMQVLDYILKHDGEDICQKDLEEVLNLARATVSGVLQTMEKNGLICRVIHEGDTRSKKIILNENTRKIFMENKKKILELEKISTKDISAQELEKFSIIIEKIKNNIKEYNTN